VKRNGSLRKKDIVAKLAAFEAPYAKAYLGEIKDSAAEANTLKHILKEKSRDNAVLVRLKALGEEYWSKTLLHCYNESSLAKDRERYVHFGVVGARENPDLLRLGLCALNDRAAIVRWRACALLAYSLDKTILPQLREALKTEGRPDIQKAIIASIDAIEHQNHHRFLSRTAPSGQANWIVNPYDSSDPFRQEVGIKLVLQQLKEGWETLV